MLTPKFGPMLQVAWVVNDLDKAMSRWLDTQSVGPFYVMSLALGLAMPLQAQTTTTNPSPPLYGLVIHGGAGAPAKGESTPENDRLCHD